MSAKDPVIGLLWSQFAAYHADRCEAVARRLEGRATVYAVEVATTSQAYAWEPSGDIAGVIKRTLFPGRSYEDIAWPRRLAAQFHALRKCDMVCFGIPYSEPDMIVLSWLLRFCGVRTVMLTESKYDDKPRQRLAELGKSLLLRAYHAAIVGARRQADYVRFLGFGRRLVLPGYDTVSTDRVRRLAGGDGDTPYAQRPFVFVGRFVEKKDPRTLIRAFARYANEAGQGARRLVMVGDGPLMPQLRDDAKALGVAGLVDFPGFLGASQVACQLGRALALILPSREEQWGLVVNEALAVGLPVVASSAVGATDMLVREGVNGYIVAPGDVGALAQAMEELSSGHDKWQAMAAASLARAHFGDTERFADAVELLIDPRAPLAAQKIAEFRREMENTAG